MSDVHAVTLKPKRDSRVAGGHPWVFSNEIDGDVKQIPPGGMVDVFDAKGKFLGRGYGNPHSLIAVRILSRRRKEDIDHASFFVLRLQEALSLRQAIYPQRDSFRLVFGEADRLPGLVIDKYADVLAVQLTTLGMETRKDAIAEALETVLGPRGAVLRNDARVRDLEGLPRESGVWFGDVPDSVSIDESGVRFEVPMTSGQKTGHFFDQHDNKVFAAPLCKGLDVLDVYSNTGGWGLHALKAGARSALCVDIDEANGERALANAAANGFEGQLEAYASEGKKTLQGFVAEGRRFGAVVVDPPAFAKQKKAAGSALRGYREVFGLGLMLVEEGGWFFPSSCSFHVFEDRFVDAIQKAAKDAGRRLTMVRRGGQSADHPTLPAVPETRYLKSYAFRVHMAA